MSARNLRDLSAWMQLQRATILARLPDEPPENAVGEVREEPNHSRSLL